MVGRREFLIPGFEVILVNFSRQMPRDIKFTFDESTVDHKPGLNVGNLSRTPVLDLTAQWLKRPLNPMHSAHKGFLERKIQLNALRDPG
jgi:hypothetical protein